MALGHPKRMVDELAAQIETFGRYGFNKSHSVAYSVLSYQTAWLKAHYPAEFMAALLSSEIGNTDKVVQYINEARELDLEVLPPDVNESGFKFTVVGDQRIRFGLGAIRNVGWGAIESHHRGPPGRGRSPRWPTSSSGSTCGSATSGCSSRSSWPARCDGLGGHRKQLLRGARRRARRGPAAPAGAGGRPGLAVRREPRRHGRGASSLPDVPPWTEAERLVKEKEVLGFFISGHPLERFRTEVELFGTRTTATLGEWSEHPGDASRRSSPA